MIMDDIVTAREKFRASFMTAPTQIAMDDDTARLLSLAIRHHVYDGKGELIPTEQIFGGSVYGMQITKLPANEHGFAVR